MKHLLSSCLLFAVLPAMAFQNGKSQDTTQLFQVYLMSASKSQLVSSDELPANVAKALDDVKDFLPFKNFKVLDVGMLRTNAVGKTVVQGPGNQPCEVRLVMEVHPNNPSHIMVRNFRVQSPHHDLIDTSFDIRRGETVVVGTSRLNGTETALLVLLTAK